jgi:hypothetical protein
MGTATAGPTTLLFFLDEVSEGFDDSAEEVGVGVRVDVEERVIEASSTE